MTLQRSGGHDTLAGLSEPATTDPESRDFVNSLARGLSVLRAFDREHTSMTLSEVAVRTGMNRAAARRFLLTLVHEGYVGTDGKHFRLRPAVLELGYSALASMGFEELVEPVTDQLAGLIGETCLVAMLDDHDVVYLARSAPEQLFTLNIGVGDRLPAFCMSTGRVLLSAFEPDALERWLATLDQRAYTDRTVTSRARLRAAVDSARSAGYSIVDQEYELGFRSVSVPIRDASGVVVAALNVCAPSARVSLHRVREHFVPAMRATAERIAAVIPHDLASRRDELLRGAAAARG